MSLPERKIRCAEAIAQIPFYCYGEVSSALEERMESHFAECETCRAELARHRAFLEAIDQRPEAFELPGVDPALLTECRNELRNTVAVDAARRQNRGLFQKWMATVNGILDMHVPLRVVGAGALVALGFVGARFTPARFGGAQTDLASAPMFSAVRSIEPDNSGHVQIAVDDVRRHVVAGSLNDPGIKDLLLSAMREESNPGVRMESIRILQSSGDTAQVQRALIDAVSRDPDAAVRLKAVEGLMPYAGDSVVRRTLANVLLKDDNPGVRVRAIDALSAHRDDSIVGVLQNVIEKEDNSYVRQHTQDLLEAMRASVGIY